MKKPQWKRVSSQDRGQTIQLKKGGVVKKPVKK